MSDAPCARALEMGEHPSDFHSLSEDLRGIADSEGDSGAMEAVDPAGI